MISRVKHIDSDDATVNENSVVDDSKLVLRKVLTNNNVHLHSYDISHMPIQDGSHPAMYSTAPEPVDVLLLEHCELMLNGFHKALPNNDHHNATYLVLNCDSLTLLFKCPNNDSTGFNHGEYCAANKTFTCMSRAVSNTRLW